MNLVIRRNRKDKFSLVRCVVKEASSHHIIASRRFDEKHWRVWRGMNYIPAPTLKVALMLWRMNL